MTKTKKILLTFMCFIIIGGVLYKINDVRQKNEKSVQAIITNNQNIKLKKIVNEKLLAKAKAKKVEQAKEAQKVKSAKEAKALLEINKKKEALKKNLAKVLL